MKDKKEGKTVFLYKSEWGKLKKIAQADDRSLHNLMKRVLRVIIY